MIGRCTVILTSAIIAVLVLSTPIFASHQPFREGGFFLGYNMIAASESFSIFEFVDQSQLDPETVDNLTVPPTEGNGYRIGYIIPSSDVSFAFKLDAFGIFDADFVEITGTEEKPPLGNLYFLGGGVIWLLGAQKEAPMESPGWLWYISPEFYYVLTDEGGGWAYGSASGLYFSLDDSHDWGYSMELEYLKYYNYWMANANFHIFIW